MLNSRSPIAKWQMAKFQLIFGIFRKIWWDGIQNQSVRNHSVQPGFIMNIETKLESLGRDKLLTYCRLKGLQPDKNLSASELAGFICTKLDIHQTRQGLRRVTDLEAQVWLDEISGRLGESIKDKESLRDSMTELQQAVTSAVNEAQTKINQAVVDADRQVGLRALDNLREVQSLLDKAELQAQKTALEASKFKENVEKQEKGLDRRFTFLQSVFLIFTVLAGITLLNNESLINKQMSLLQKDADAAASNLVTIVEYKNVANSNTVNFKLTYTGLNEFLLTSLDSDCQRIAEKIAFRMTPDESNDVRMQISEEIAPALRAMKNLINVPDSTLDGSSNYYELIKSFISNVTNTLPIVGNSWNSAKVSAVQAVTGGWLQMPTDYPTNLINCQKQIQRIKAFREFMIGGGEVLEADIMTNNSLFTNSIIHFTNAIAIDPEFPRPYSSMGVAFSRRLRIGIGNKETNTASLAKLHALAMENYQTAYDHTTDPEARLRILNNEATTSFRWAQYLFEQHDTNSARKFYSVCRTTLDKAKDFQILDKDILATEAESLGMTVVLDPATNTTNVEDTVVALLKRAVDDGIHPESVDEYLHNTPMKFINHDARFVNNLKNVLTDPPEEKTH